MKNQAALHSLIIILSVLTFGSGQTTDYSLDYDKYIFFHWKGALTSHSLTLQVFPQLANLKADNYSTYLILNHQNGETLVSSVTQIEFEEKDHPVTKVLLNFLDPNTYYTYGFIFIPSDSTLDDGTLSNYNTQNIKEFHFTTLGLALTAFNFTFGAASCATTGSESTVFNSLHQEDFQFFMHMGDLHYSNIVENITDKFYTAYNNVFSSKTQKLFFEGTPFFYVWDDHDFGTGDSTGKSPSRYAANYVYRDYVPYAILKNKLPADDSSVSEAAPEAVTTDDLYINDYPTDTDYGVFQSFIVGRCLFIVMDLRTYKDIIDGDLLGAEQTTWLENQFRFAGNNDEIVQVFMISSFSWIHETKVSEWSPYPKVQTAIAGWVNQYITQKNKKIMMVSGDAHMVAFDDGSNNKYGGFPVVQAAAMDRNGSCKGGPYSHGFFPGTGQYGILNFIDYGNGTICTQVNLTNKGESLIYYDTCHPEEHPRKQASCPVTPAQGGGSTETTTTEREDTSTWWVWVLIGFAALGIVAYILWMRHKKSQLGMEQEADPERADYIEMSEPKNNKRKNGY